MCRQNVKNINVFNTFTTNHFMNQTSLKSFSSEGSLHYTNRTGLGLLKRTFFRVIKTVENVLKHKKPYDQYICLQNVNNVFSVINTVPELLIV